ncbi:MAG: hypothetical protein M1822_006621 [Bathelium mastoideum]|nr:MAG: hypothetical protein M1822_006621 [Bathelium mastoideum]
MRTTRSGDYDLKIRQQPREALVAQDGKGKARKPVDPPPIIQVSVREDVDPSQTFLQSPYLFMCCSLCVNGKTPEQLETHRPSTTLAGSLVSSLHRLKDIDNRDGGFFVFGDLSVKIVGEHRLHFSLFEMRKETHEVVYLTSITSEYFTVSQHKDWKGLDESTVLSRAFSDQGVRLRLRKEPRGLMAGSKRSLHQYGATTSGDTPAPATSLAQQSPVGFGYGASGPTQWSDLSNKRQRQEDFSGYDYGRDPYRQVSSYDNSRGSMYHNRQGAAFGDVSHSRQSSQGQYPYPSPQGSDISSYYQGQSYAPQQGRMGLSFRPSDMMGHLTLEQATNSPTPGQVNSHRYTDPAATGYPTMPSRRPESRASRSSFGQESSHGTFGYRDLQNPLDMHATNASDRQNTQQQQQHPSQLNLLPPLSGSQSTSLTSQDPFNFASLPHRDTPSSLLSSQQASTGSYGNTSPQQNSAYQNTPDQQLSAFSNQLPLSGSRPPSRTAEAYAPADPPPSYTEPQAGYDASFQNQGPAEYYSNSHWQGGGS